MIWAVHFGYDNDGRISLPSLVEIMESSKVNIIGLVETDSMRIFMENRDIVEYLAEKLHVYSDYGPTTAQNTWGCGLLTTFPIVRAEHINLPSPEGELACMIDADVRLGNGTLIRVIVTHFGNTEDRLDLVLQSDYLADMIRSPAGDAERKPTILIGYLTMAPFSDRYEKIMQSGWCDTTNSLDRYCEYVLYKDLTWQWFRRLDKGNVSDTEAQLAGFRLISDTAGNNHADLPANCYKFHNDTVPCQASRVCGWCQLDQQGHCYSPEYRDACKSFRGSWIGPVLTTGEVRLMR